MRRDSGLPEADLLIGCGRQAIAPLITARRRGHAFTCYVQDPRIDPNRFNMVVAPEHDALSGSNVEPMIGSPNRVTGERITREGHHFKDQIAGLPQPRAMLAIGGPSRTHRLSRADIQAYLQAAQDLLANGYGLLITTSRRTPASVQTQWEQFAASSSSVWLHTPDSDGDNPYFAFLDAADIILVSEDSTNMLTESCATGKPVYRLPMSGQSGKFQQLYDSLATRCGVRRWNGVIDSLPYEPLDETARIARILLDRYCQQD